ncbi:MAG: hypothetical protein COB65_01130 [Thalassobium sp.]|nr:MAG: hypothetical protein COB65_01130 [Thalassobium sp.]
MNMDVSDHFISRISAVSPKRAKAPTIDDYDPAVQRTRVDIVVENKLFNPPRAALLSKQESAAFTPSKGATMQFCNASIPNIC